MSDIFVYEVLFRGRDAEQEPGVDSAFHVVLGKWVTDDFSGATELKTTGALTPEQAKEKGFDLPDLLSAINAQMTDDNARLTADKAALLAQIDTMNTALSQAQAAMQQAADHVADLEADYAALQAQLAPKEPAAA